MGTQGLARHQFHRLPKLFFEQKREGHEVIEGLFTGREFDQEVYVALVVGRVALKRPKDAKPPHAETPQVVPVAAYPPDQVLFGLNWSHSTGKSHRPTQMLPLGCRGSGRSRICRLGM